MSRLNDIEKLRGWCHKILPLVYDDSLSYYEVLCKVRAKLNEVIDLTSEQNEVIEEVVQEVADWETTTDEKYEEFTRQINEAFDIYKGTVDNEVEDFERTVNTDFANFTKQIIHEFDGYTNYQTGDYTYYEKKIYKCVSSPIAPFPRQFSDYTWTAVGDNDGVIKDLKSYLSQYIAGMSNRISDWIYANANLYTETTYKKGDICVNIGSTSGGRQGLVYFMAKQDIDVAESWTASHWEQVKLADALLADIRANYQAMLDTYDDFLETYQRTWGIVQTTGSSTTDAMSQKATTDELNNLQGQIDTVVEDFAENYDNTVAYKVGDLLTYQSQLYYCIADASAGTLPTNTTYFEEKSVADIVEMIKNGSIVTAHSEVADNLTPYSEESGTTQENPFISQGTGTDNNSVIVTTGVIARQLEKQGNTVVENQLLNLQYMPSPYTSAGITFTKNNDGTVTISGTATDLAIGPIYSLPNIIKGHWYLFVGGDGENYGLNSYDANMWGATGIIGTAIVQANDDGTPDTWRFIVRSGVTINTTFLPAFVDVTQYFNGNDNIPQDLISNPTHYTWYMTIDSNSVNAGLLANCNGRYLECGQGRNLFDQQTEIDSDLIVSKNITRVVPNKPIYLWIKNNSFIPDYGVFIKTYDRQGNVISGYTRLYLTGDIQGHIYNVPADVYGIKFGVMTQYYGNTYNNDISVELYYPPEEGGEGYGEMHDYVAPIRIDTGNETLKAFDKKVPSGVITRTTLPNIDLGDISWTYDDSGDYPVFYGSVSGMGNGGYAEHNVVCSKYAGEVSMYLSNAKSGSLPDKSICLLRDNNYLIVRDSDYTTVPDFTTAVTGVKAEAIIAEPYTEQGTTFSEYAPINDYSYMAWFDADGNLVSIPQGCKLFYPVDYKGFLDDGVMYTNGDFTSLAKKEDIADTVLNARGYYKMQDLSSNITNTVSLTCKILKAYKTGNIVTLTVDATNETGNAIAMGATIFSLTSGLYNTNGNIASPVRITGNTALGTIKNNGEFVLDTSLANNSSLFVVFTYAVS